MAGSKNILIGDYIFGDFEVIDKLTRFKVTRVDGKDIDRSSENADLDKILNLLENIGLLENMQYSLSSLMGRDVNEVYANINRYDFTETRISYGQNLSIIGIQVRYSSEEELRRRRLGLNGQPSVEEIENQLVSIPQWLSLKNLIKSIIK